MLNRTFAFVSIGYLIAATLTGCTDSSGKKLVDAQQGADTIRQQPASADDTRDQDWQTFKSESEQKISANEDMIDSLRERIKRSDVKLKSRYRKSAEDLERKNAELKSKLAEYKHDGKDDWDTFKHDFTTDLNKVEKELENLVPDHS
jgi:uncharacterized protein YeaO (DUF488 family)